MEDINKTYKLKKDFALFVNKLKQQNIKLEFEKQTAIVGFKKLVKDDQLTSEELKKVYKDGVKAIQKV